MPEAPPQERSSGSLEPISLTDGGVDQEDRAIAQLNFEIEQ